VEAAVIEGEMVLRVVCHAHPSVTLLRRGILTEGERPGAPTMDMRPSRRADLRRITYSNGTAKSHGRCSAPGCRVNPQWRMERIDEVMAAIAAPGRTGTWTVTDIEMDAMVRQPDSAWRYLSSRP
jgi:hypothetical protein